MYKLLKDSVTWRWTEPEQAAFDTCKGLLTSDRVLAHYDSNLPLTLACDDSTWNIQGSNNVIERKSVLDSLKKDEIQIAFLQETYLHDEEHKIYCRDWVGQIVFSSYSTNKRGVIILIHKKLPFTVTASYNDREGRCVLVRGVLYGEDILLGNLYAPNVRNERFYTSLYCHDDIIAHFIPGKYNLILL
uniref:Reverse transcriptase/retrotransposon-derived protein RNase H-like domain-containing protein n=1 Tax=Fundulus heteroclitus TaxID=8078 RepID=A0A3Q2NYL8_FUNHE